MRDKDIKSRELSRSIVCLKNFKIICEGNFVTIGDLKELEEEIPNIIKNLEEYKELIEE